MSDRETVHNYRIDENEIVFWDDSGNPLADSGTSVSFEGFLQNERGLQETVREYFGEEELKAIIAKITEKQSA